MCICMGEADRFKRITIPNHPARGKEWQNVRWWRWGKRSKPNQEKSGNTRWRRVERDNETKPTAALGDYLGTAF